MGWKPLENSNADYKTPPTGGSGVTIYPERGPAAANVFYTEVVKCSDVPGRITPLWVHEWIEIPSQPVQILPEPLKYESGWKEEVADLVEQVHNLLEWCQELTQEIETLKREKLDRFSKGITLL